MSRYLAAAGTLLEREVVRFLRQRDRVVGALGTPLVFWFLIGSGLGRSFRSSDGFGGAGLGYLQYFFPGTLVLILLFTAVFSTISIIEDRREGFLQGVLVSPVPRSVIVLGKLSGGAALAFGQALLFLAAAPFLGASAEWGNLALAALVLLLLSFALTGLGFVMAWRMDSTQGFHAVMNLFLMPLWFLSGALFPASGAPDWLRAVMALNPLTYGVAALHRALFPAAGAPFPSSWGLCLGISCGFAAAMFLLSLWTASRRTV